VRRIVVRTVDVMVERQVRGDMRTRIGGVIAGVVVVVVVV